MKPGAQPLMEEMTPAPRNRLRKAYAGAIIVGVLGIQFWTIVPDGTFHHWWYWPFLNYPMYSGARHPGEEYVRYELWAGPVGRPELLRPISQRELHLTTLVHGQALRVATNRDGPVIYGHEESASEFISRLVAQRMPAESIRLQIWEERWRSGATGGEDRMASRVLEREWTVACEIGGADATCAGGPP